MVEGVWRVTIVGYDYPGELSLICGLLLVHGFDIVDGEVFTYEPLAPSPQAPRTETRQGWRRQPYRRFARRPETPPAGANGPPAAEDVRQKIVDVFTVRS